MVKDQLSVTIKNPEKVVFQGQAKAVTSENDKGVFDILPRHANFISLIKNKIVVWKEEGAREAFQIHSGLIRVGKNQVQVYLDIASPL
jgi:F-type H+-transporting ATPase subunit epsilon